LRHADLQTVEEAIRQAESEVKASLQAAEQAREALFYGRDQVTADVWQRLIDAEAARDQAVAEAARAADQLADVSVRATLLELMVYLKEEFQLTYLFITHDLATCKYICNRIAIMYLGKIVEQATSEELFRNPLHPYTQALISAVPTIDIHHKKERIILEGEITSPIDPKPGCRFMKRCRYECKPCHEPQQLEEVMPNHFVACCRVSEINTF
jgi:oligopeptide/dipeptide ABC transporter ATP-binding protein